MRSAVLRLISNTLLFNLFITVISATALGFAYYMQDVQGLDPCPLCLYQRWPFRATIILGLIGAALAYFRQPRHAAKITLLCAPVFLAGSGAAAYHAGVERHWWKSFLEGCAAQFDPHTDLMSQIQNRHAARCDEIAWSFMGLTMADYNIAFSLGLAALSLLASILMLRRANGYLK